ncbi:hydroxymethylbilane synthase [Flavobacteriaceae bacterium F89]|uniref:Hydroxymethylbilane synthase n=1 Tax=Cerina litoralis TaxID=2874477 RepID=A0AAE3EVC7_9FLAO|nr:hydroxymethylbilane synthase [Cerina litoralis]MCG2460884.1 hydroxymethylbilane synthase [Cerina litoralis]
MSIIRIGTRDSELALWQATTVQEKLEKLGHVTALVPVKSTGDLVLDKPLYQMGMVGVFTRNLDVALLNNDIDIAVHSLKDVPTVLPEGIIQAAVLERGNYYDILVYKNNEEFLGQKEGVVATGSLRRKAQWLNRYPTHTIADLRGNVNSRLQKLTDNNWNGAIFAGAGLERIGVKPEESVGLGWMVPAPGQGTIMIASREQDAEIREICAALNHEETEICTTVERTFLNLLEGGCTAPIGALALIKKDGISFKGVLLSEDGAKKIEVEKTTPLGEHYNLAKICAEYVIARGGKRLMDGLNTLQRKPNIYSTKTLSEDQKHMFNQGIVAESSDFVKISINRIPKSVVKDPVRNVIITSKNTVESLLTNFSKEELQFENIYCVGRKTKRFIEKRIGPVKHVEKNAEKLADYLVEYIEGTEVTYFCSDIRMDTLPDKLEENLIEVREVKAYQTKLDPVKLDGSVKGILFFSPSTIQSFLLENNVGDRTAYCIGETTANEAKNYFKEVEVAKFATVEDVISLVNETYKNF